MKVERWLSQFQAADAAIAAAWRRAAPEEDVHTQVKGAILEMERILRDAQEESGSMAGEQRQSVCKHIQVYSQKLQDHRSALQVAVQASARGQLLQSGNSAGERKRQQPTSKEEGQQQELLKLTQARDQLRNEFDRMQGIATNLDGSSDRLKQTRDQYHLYEGKLKYASQRLGQLKRKMDEDSRYIWWSFCFFLAVSGYIFLKRLRVFRMLWLAGSFGAWSGSSAFAAVHGILHQLASLYRGVGDLLGFSADLETATGTLEG